MKTKDLNQRQMGQVTVKRSGVPALVSGDLRPGDLHSEVLISEAPDFGSGSVLTRIRSHMKTKDLNQSQMGQVTVQRSGVPALVFACYLCKLCGLGVYTPGIYALGIYILGV